VLPHPASLSSDTFSLANDGDVLAWKPPRYHVNKSAPWSPVKGLNVIPDRERRENAVILSGGKNASGVWFTLDSADGAPSEQFASQYATSSARE
jgi:hypothetical protein